MTDKHLLLVDASGFAYRAYATANPIYRASDGQPTGAVLAFMQMVWRMRGAAQADLLTHGAAIFDPPGKTFRHWIFPAYKSNRPAARPMELDDQMPLMRHAADAMGLAPIERKGFEADDVIATLVRMALELGWRTTIVSSDKDFGQLVVDGKVEIVDPMQKRRVLAADIIEKFGVPPALVPDVQALAGDTVDGIPGVGGCGMKRAGALVRRFGGLENVLANIDGIHWPQVKTYLKRKHRYPGLDDSRVGKEWARLFLQLTTLRQDVDLEIGPADLTLQPVMRRHLVEILRVLEASAHMEAVFALDPQVSRVVEHVEDPDAWWREELVVSGQRPPDVPQCGYYKRKLVKGGPFVVARIWREPETHLDTGEKTGMDVLRCEVGGKLRDPYAEWVRLSMTPIKAEEYRFEVADAEHAKNWRPGDPKATPHEPIDLLKAKAPHNPTPKRRKIYDKPL